MEFRILGPLEAHDDGRELALPRGRARALLALLLLHRGEVVSTDRIVNTLWGERPPPTAGKAVQGYVSALRRSLNSDGTGSGPLVTRPPGYVLQVAADELDAAKFELLVAEGRRALEDDEPEEALTALERGLALWRGPALAEFAFEEFAQGELQRLDELRLDAIDDRVEALLRLGRGAELVGELEACVARHPLRERSRGLLMLALYRAGRQADALQSYAEGRRLLKLELGLDPSRELQELERRILAQDPTLDAFRRPVPGRPDAPERAGRHGPDRRRLVAVAALVALAVAGAVALAAVLRSPDAGGATGPPPAHGMLAVDTDSGEVVARTELGSRPGVVAAAGDAVWVGDVLDGVLTRVDARSGKVVKSIGIGAPALDVAVGPDAVWVATGSSGTIVRVDPEIGAVVDRIDLAGADDVVVPDAAGVTVGDDGMLWVASAEGILRVDPDSKRIRRIDVGPTRVSAVAPVGRAVWANVLDGRTLRLEAGPGTPTAEFSGPGAGPLAADADGVWISSVGSLVSLDPQDASLRGAVPAGGFVIGIALEGDIVWAAVLEKQALLRVNARSLEVEQAIPLGAYPLAVAVDGGRVWVCVVKENPFA